MGYTDGELQRPMVGIASSTNEIVPGHIHLERLVDAVKAYAFDAIVLIPNCDKIVPGVLMAAARLDIPNREVRICLSEQEIQERVSTWNLPDSKITRVYVCRYAQDVSSASDGAIFRQERK